MKVIENTIYFDIILFNFFYMLRPICGGALRLPYDGSVDDGDGGYGSVGKAKANNDILNIKNNVNAQQVLSDMMLLSDINKFRNWNVILENIDFLHQECRFDRYNYEFL